MQKNDLTNKERSLFTLSSDLKEIMVGLILGDLFIQKQKTSKNVRLEFTQGTVHKEYIHHLYGLFGSYCGMVPKIFSQGPNQITGKIYTSIGFKTYSLPCFNELYGLFYPLGEKIVPQNIGELLTPLGFCYWICDDGSFCQRDRAIILNTQGFSLEEVNLLISVLTTKFNLQCTKNKSKNAFVTFSHV